MSSSDSPDSADPARASPRRDEDGPDPERWLVIDGKAWRRTDPSLPEEIVKQLTSHLGRARSAVRSARSAGDDDALAVARSRVNAAKHGLGERGPYWWDQPEGDRLERAEQALTDLATDGPVDRPAS